jgi:hypothetical protein
MILVSKFLVPKGYFGLTFFPFVFLKFKSLKGSKILINHEKIHLRQQMELLVLPFYIWYFLEYLIRFIDCKNHRLAYRNISFEREAYVNEKDLNYIKSRSFFSFLKYM